jgi:oligopeptide/dipeptide ABC transporter ATP-binding protein
MTEHPMLMVRDLCKYFPIMGRGFIKRPVGWIKAVDGLNFDVLPGETLGLVGESGSGKTTAIRALLQAIQPTRGEVLFRDAAWNGGRAMDLARLGEAELKPLRRRMQMIFQDPFSSLNPRMTVRSIIGEPLYVHKLARGVELERLVAEMAELVGLNPDHLGRYPHAFSGGQRQRIGIARALIMRPALVIADEPVSALDVSVQAQIINLLRDLQEQLHLTYIFVAHDLSVVRHFCDRVAVMYAGRLVELARTDQLFAAPAHPYTRTLIGSIPSPDPDIPLLANPHGEVVDLGALPIGCSFGPRCSRCGPVCLETAPPLCATADGRLVACHMCKESATLEGEPCLSR